MRSRFCSVLLPGAVGILLSLPGCSADPPTSQTSSPSPDLESASSALAHDALLSKIGRGLALASSDQGMRRWLRSRIDASPYVEWRIPLREVLLQEAGLPEVRRVVELSRMTQVERDGQKALPDLELYFPLTQHRSGWKATEPVQVAVRIGHTDTYTLYTADGTASTTRGDYVPATATLVLARSEIDYHDLPSAVRGGSRTGPGMLARARPHSGPGAAALPPPEEPPPPPPPTGGANTSRHTRLASFRTTRYHDDLFSGRDEVEIYGSVYGGFKECTWRTDVSPNRDYYMDIASSFSTIATAVPWGTATVFIDAFEDDDGRCLRRSSDDRYGSTFLTIDEYGPTFGTSNPGHIAVSVHSRVP